MVEPTFKPLIPKHYRRSCFGGYIRKTPEDERPLRLHYGKPREDGSIVVTVLPNPNKETVRKP